jgi:phosphate:Na+ symporter
VVLYHLSFNMMVALVFIGFTRWWRGWVSLAAQAGPHHRVNRAPRHLDPSALATPSLAISCAAREALHQADVVETMLLGMLKVIKQQRPASWPKTCARWTTRWTSCTPPSSTT